jgi:hypothetical protein
MTVHIRSLAKLSADSCKSGVKRQGDDITLSFVQSAMKRPNIRSIAWVLGRPSRLDSFDSLCPNVPYLSSYTGIIGDPIGQALRAKTPCG